MSAVKTEAEATAPALAGGKDDPKDAERREFFAKLGMGSLIVAAMGTGLFTYEYFSPNVLFEPSPIIKACKPDQFPPGTVTLDPRTRIYVINGPKGFYALSAICTHLGCLTAWKPELNLIACPCHGSRFNRDGVKVAGPAPNPLPWLKIWLSDDGYLMVDRSAQLKGEEFLRV